METELAKGRRNLILANACVITFMATLDGSVVNIALPTIAHNLRVGIQAVQWVVTAYLLAISSLLLVWGRLSDIHGRRRFFAAGLAVFTLGSLLCGLSNSIAALVASRVLQAVGASMAMALVQGIVTSAFPSAKRGKALGFIGAVVSIGSLIGPSVGGLLVAAAGWRSIFFVNVPIGVLGVVLTFMVMPESKAAGKKASFDAPGAVLMILAIALFFSGLLAFQQGILPLGAAAAAVIAALALFLAFLRVERRVDPLVDGSLFKSRVFTIGVVTSAFSYVAMFSYTFFMPFYLQGPRGLSVLQAGALMSIYPVVTAVLAPVAGALSDRITYRPLTVAGLFINGVGLVLLATLGGQASLLATGAVVFILGVGGASFQSPNNSSVMGSVPRDRLGIAGSINSFFRNLGMVSGTTIAVSLFSFTTKARIDQVASGSVGSELFLRGFRVVGLVAAGFAFGGMVLELCGRSRRN